MPARLIALVAILAATHFSYGIAGSFEEDGAVWRFQPIHYCVNPAGLPAGPDKQPLLTAGQFSEMVGVAFQKWQDAPGSELKFIHDGFCTGIPGRRDRLNVVGWRNLGRMPASGVAFPNESSGRYLRGGASYEMLEADIVLNSRVDFYKSLDEYLATILPSTILHEVGHFIGLGHSEVLPCSVMTSEEVFPVELCQDDIDGAARLYP